MEVHKPVAVRLINGSQDKSTFNHKSLQMAPDQSRILCDSGCLFLQKLWLYTQLFPLELVGSEQLQRPYFLVWMERSPAAEYILCGKNMFRCFNASYLKGWWKQHVFKKTSQFCSTVFLLPWCGLCFLWRKVETLFQNKFWCSEHLMIFIKVSCFCSEIRRRTSCLLLESSWIFP